MTTSWNSSMLFTDLRAERRYVAGLSGKRYSEIARTAGWLATLLRAFTASSSLYGDMLSNSDESNIMFAFCLKDKCNQINRQ